MVEFTSVAGLPARAVATPWLKAYLKVERGCRRVAQVQAALHQGLRLPGAMRPARRQGRLGSVLHRQQLAAAMRGDVKQGLFFSGAGALPFGEQIRSVRELVERLLTRGVAVPQPA